LASWQLRRFDMQSFRFPRSAIFLIVATFLTLLAAIALATEMARRVQASYPGPNLPAMWWSKLPAMFVTVFLLFWGIGAIGYAVLFGLRRTGAHRLSNIETWPARRE
jgi:MFS superfamily sulfate permease-like transporter